MHAFDLTPENCISDREIIANIEAAIALDLPTVEMTLPHKGVLVIACSGPSLATSLPDIRRRKAKGAYVLATNGAYPYLVARGIIPDGFVMCDPRDDNLEFVEAKQRTVTHYIASQCHPNIFAALAGYPVTTWHVACHLDSPPYQAIPGWMELGGGSTVGLRAFNLGVILGYRTIHYYGLDSCYLDGQLRAMPQADRNPERFTVTCAGARFLVNSTMAMQANDFVGFMQKYNRLAKVYVHGPGLIAHINKVANEHGRHARGISVASRIECGSQRADGSAVLRG